MLTISIIFAVLVALWGFSGALASVAKRRLASANERNEPVAARAAAARPRRSGARPRSAGPIASS